MGVYRGEFLPGNPKFPEGSAAVCKDTATGPVDSKAADITYTEEDDKAIEEYNRNYGMDLHVIDFGILI